MKAVLVGAIHEDKLYYVIDAGPGEKDGIVEKPNGSSVKVNFISLTSKVSGLKKFRTTRFHRFLWDKPADVINGSWYKTFITKEREVQESSLEKATILTSVGKAKKILQSKNEKVLMFTKSIDNKSDDASLCCGEMVKSINSDYSFSTLKDRSNAWVAIKIMRQMEGN